MAGKATGGKNQQAQMEQHAQQGWECIETGRFDEAEAAYVKALKGARQLGHPQAEAVFLNYLGLAKRSQGRMDAARKDFEECLAIAGTHGLTRVEAHARIMLGEAERDDDNTDAAIQQFMRALEASLDCSDAVGIEMSFGNLGLLYLECGWAEQASECFRQALDAGESSPNRAAWLGSLGQALAELGQFQQSIRYYRESFEEAVLCDNLGAQANARGSEGNAHFELGVYAEAIVCYREALELINDVDDPLRSCVWLGNLGNAFRKLGDIESAISTTEEALTTARSVADVHSQAAHLDSLGDCYTALGKDETALGFYQEALDLSQTIVDRQGQRIYLSNIGKAQERLGQLAPAFESLSRAIELFDEQRARIKSDDLKTTFAARGQDLYRDMVNVCLTMGRRVEALEYVGRAKSRAILDLLANSPIDVSELEDSEDGSLKKLIVREAELRGQISRLERLFWQGTGGGGEAGHRGAAKAPEDTKDIYTEWRETVNQLKRRHPNYASLIAVDTLNFNEIGNLWAKSRDKKALLEENVAIVEFYWTDQYFLAAGLWSGCAEPVIYHVPNGQALSALEADLADFLEMSATEGWDVPVGLCKRLYDALMQPLLQGMPATVDRLILVPHSTLYRLPFGALHDGNGFLIERFALSYLPTTSLIPVLARSRAETSAPESTPKYLVSAISDYSATRKEGVVFSSRLRSAAGLEDLGYTMEEARTIFDLGEEHSGSSRMLTNEEVRNELPALFSEYPVVHFAGHAVFNPDEPLASGLVLADGSILTAASILQGNSLRTHCGKLLVLSACQTGVNMVTPGGEILGLARALMYAGMPNLILSLWEVADRSTSDLMQDFHKMWQAGKTSISQALQHAQKKALSDRQSIHAWAPFIHMGID